MADDYFARVVNASDEGEALYVPDRQRSRKRLVRLLPLFVGALALVQYLAIYRGNGSPALAWLVVLTGVAGVALFVLASRWSSRANLPLAGAVMKADPGPPVLLLRSFLSDAELERFAVRLARATKELGPLVAIGNPDDKLPRKGAAPEYVAPDAKEAWQERVADHALSHPGNCGGSQSRRHAPAGGRIHPHASPQEVPR